jgi:hypothetical protein
MFIERLLFHVPDNLSGGRSVSIVHSVTKATAKGRRGGIFLGLVSLRFKASSREFSALISETEQLPYM